MDQEGPKIMTAPTTHQHLMKTTRRGRPFVKDTHDLFATMIVSLRLDTHRHFFKSYPNSFTTDDACSNLHSLKFSQSNRAADPKDPTRIITTTTTTTFSMERDMAKGICQHFLEAHLIENATDLDSTTFKDRGIYMITPKGLHILERFITKNGISATHIIPIYAQQPICMKLLHLERRSQDDEVIITKSVIEVLFRRFIGRNPNVTKMSDEELESHYRSRWYNQKRDQPRPEDILDRALGIPLKKVSIGNGGDDEYQFGAMLAMDWLADFTTSVGLDETAEMAAHFVRYGLITLVNDRGKVKDNNMVVKVRGGGAGGASGAVMAEAEFRATDKAIYKITREGFATAHWFESSAITSASRPNLMSNNTGTSSSSSASKSSQSTESPRNESLSVHSTPRKQPSPGVPQSTPRSDFPEGPTGLLYNDPNNPHAGKDSHTAKLRQIMDEPALRSLFREFLRANFCEENLSFWLDVQDFKRRFNTTSSAIASPGNDDGKSNKGNARLGVQAMEKHQQDLIALAFVIYNKLISYMNQVTEDKDAGGKTHLDPTSAEKLQASQVQTMMRLYERIQTHIFRLMATDSIPKFVKTERFLTLARTIVVDYNDKYTEGDVGNLAIQAQNMALNKAISMDDLPTPSPTRAYLTISQAANEKQAAIDKRRMGLA